jgi:NADH:ubiquinone oxidoreductase subunit F (NADH-binding)/(2Fe-2S) ferredoxin/NAD-dependent dihydropyrimidine dehydrogenase PreA subunit
VPTTIQQQYDELVRTTRQSYDANDFGHKIRIQVGSATCEHAAGSREVMAEFQKHISSSGRTDIVLHRTGCTGRCSREPIVGILAPGKMPVKYDTVDRDLVHKIFTEHILGGAPVKERILDSEGDKVVEYECLFCSRDRCGRDKMQNMKKALIEKLAAAGSTKSRVYAGEARCFGACVHSELGTCSHMLVRPSGVLYRIRTEADLDEIVKTHLLGGKVVEHLRVAKDIVGQEFFDLYGDVAFFNRQSRIALRNCGVIDPESIDEYVHFKGFSALSKVLGQGEPQVVIDEISKSNLRGRGGAGFPTGTKWMYCARAKEKTRYIICNADEGDPGAFMDRSMLESDPFSVLEGMMIGAYAIGACRGFFYIRAEYPLAIKRIQHAIEKCREHGVLGKNIFGSGFDFDVEIRLGAGAFVCGEETALIHSIEGDRGQPTIRPPYPAEAGLWGKPTVINNVETFANIAAIINFGSEWFKRLGTENKSGGTKVFALAGKVNHTGLVEVPMGTTLREVVFEIGGGVKGGKALKAILTGGPAGGCIPAKWIDTKVDYDTLAKAGSIMGSGGMIVLDEDDCMVDIAKFFLTFSQDESCGKCTPCREGTKRMLEILERITMGKGEMEDLGKLERLAKLIKKASLCGLGRAAPNPVLSTLEHFHEEYLAHIVDRACPAKKCKALVRYEVNAEKCVGCTTCARNCPVSCITGKRREVHVIDQQICIKCGRCFEVCRFAAIDRK